MYIQLYIDIYAINYVIDHLPHTVNAFFLYSNANNTHIYGVCIQLSHICTPMYVYLYLWIAYKYLEILSYIQTIHLTPVEI